MSAAKSRGAGGAGGVKRRVSAGKAVLAKGAKKPKAARNPARGKASATKGGTRGAKGAKRAGEAAALAAYFAGLAPNARRVAKALGGVIRRAAPGAVDAYSYRIAAFRLDGRMLLWYAGWKDYVSMYPITRAMAQEGGEELAPFRASKGTLKFPLDAPLPAGLVERLVRARVREMRGEDE